LAFLLVNVVGREVGESNVEDGPAGEEIAVREDAPDDDTPAVSPEMVEHDRLIDEAKEAIAFIEAADVEEEADEEHVDDGKSELDVAPEEEVSEKDEEIARLEAELARLKGAEE